MIGAAAQRANCSTEVSREGAQAAARQTRQKAPGDVPCADHVKRKHAAGQRAKERLLELSEVDDRGLLRETRGLVVQLAPGMASVDSGPHHVLGDAGDPRNSWRNLLAIRKRNEARMQVRDCVAGSDVQRR